MFNLSELQGTIATYFETIEAYTWYYILLMCKEYANVNDHLWSSSDIVSGVSTLIIISLNLRLPSSVECESGNAIVVIVKRSVLCASAVFSYQNICNIDTYIMSMDRHMAWKLAAL